MCGIVGVVGKEIPCRMIERMTDRLAHRGPDDRGIWFERGAALGHRRLAILDLSDAGRQPMTFGDYTIVFNGEIYNFKQLRKEMPGPFVSNTDTEVLLRLFDQEGEACVERLEGMFGLAIWDRRRRRLFLARDRLGIKPLHYRELPGGGIAFASEIKALVELERPSIDHSALHDFFTYKYIPAPKSIFLGIRKLMAAHTLSWNGSVAIRRYWRPTSSESVSDPEQGLERLESLLPRVVEDHTLSDVPVGVFLSGGIDSTTLVANLKDASTFTLSFDVRSHDERQAAGVVAEHFGSRHFEEVARRLDLEEALEAIPEIFDEPFGDHGAWPVFMIARAARKQVTVALVGEGGDELFAGYHWYAKWPRSQAYGVLRALSHILPPLSSAGRSLERRAAEGLERYAMFLGLFTPAQKRALLAPQATLEGYDDLWSWRRFWREDLQPIKRLQWVDIHTYLADDMLTKVDRATMAVSLEARPPFLDHRLVEFALDLDSRLLRNANEGKVLVRRHLAGRVPPSILARPKIGLSMPVRRWVRRRPGLLKGPLGRLAKAGILRPIRHPFFNNEQIWSLLVLDRWSAQNGLY